MTNKLLLSSLLCVLICSQVFSVEIPLSGAVKRGKSSGNGIVFVDMERVFNSHPMSERLKNEMKGFAKTRKDAIEAMIKQHENLQEQLKEISVKITEAQAAEDEAALSDLAMRLDSAQQSVEEQKAKISDLSARTKQELGAMEEKNSLIILKDIEAVLLEVSRKHDSEIMLDKQSVLWGSDSCEDVTDEVIKRLEGR
ncbi:MAG: OmpH family outer membrane protein [Endomicrobia bacterium]|nr:OmpH family outer membrane protein [Endomicrobiia bacterium]